jgi:hypothetical protein
MSNFDVFKEMPEDRLSRSAILLQVIDGDTQMSGHRLDECEKSGSRN